MGCQSEVKLGENLTFSVCTHNPETAVLTNADDLPEFRIYENETATPILTGVMDDLDPGNTTGFYAKTIACTAANGFEENKTYTIYATAVVVGYRGGISFAFRVSIGVADVLRDYPPIYINSNGDLQELEI